MWVDRTPRLVPKSGHPKVNATDWGVEHVEEYDCIIGPDCMGADRNEETANSNPKS
jgi:hypothetical protein